MSEISIKCLGCGRPVVVPADLVSGQHVRCPYCDVKFSYSLRERASIPSYDELKGHEEMLIKCQHCRRTIVVDDDIKSGQHVRCPYCERKFSYLKYGNEDELNMDSDKATVTVATQESTRPTGKLPVTDSPLKKRSGLDEKKEAARIKAKCEKKTRRKERRLSTIVRGIACMLAFVTIIFAVAIWLFKHETDNKRIELRNALARYISDNSQVICDCHAQFSDIIKECRQNLLSLEEGSDEARKVCALALKLEAVQDEIERTTGEFGNVALLLDGMSVEEIKTAQTELERQVGTLHVRIGNAQDDALKTSLRSPDEEKRVLVRPISSSQTEGVSASETEKSGSPSSTKQFDVKPPAAVVPKPPSLQEEINRLIKRLKYVHYSFDPESLKKFDLKTQVTILREMWDDYVMSQKRRPEREQK